MSKAFYGLPIIALENEHLRIEALAQSGPRLVRIMVAGSGENLLAELPGLKIDTPFGPYAMQGGHRLWHAPEAMPRTYIPDDQLQRAVVEDGEMILEGIVEPFTAIQKKIFISLLPDSPAIRITQTLTNTGAWPVELACWSITQLPLGGMAILPQPTTPVDAGGYLPNRALVLWPYTRWNDPRLNLHDDIILIKGDSELPPLKIGYANSAGWAGYLRNGVLLLKQFEKSNHRPYPDIGCNNEVYVNHLFLELETLGNLVQLPPNETTSLSEIWKFYPGLTEFPHSLKGVRSLVNDLGLSGSQA